MSEETRENQVETVNPYLAEETVKQDTDSANSEPVNEEPVAGKPQEPKKKDTAAKVVIRLIAAAAVILIAVLIIVFSGVLKSEKKIVEEALKETFAESGDYIETAWSMEEFEGMFEEETQTVEAEFSLPEGVGLDMIVQQDGEVCGFYIDASMAGSSVIAMEAYLDDSVLVFALPDMLDYAFTINRETLSDDIWNLVDMGMFTEEDAEMFIALNEGQQESEISEETLTALAQDIIVSCTEFYNNCTVEKTEEKELYVDGEDRKCKGYSLVVEYTKLADLLDEILTAFEENEEIIAFLESYMQTEYEYEDVDIYEAFDELREEIDTLREDEERQITVDFYVYDGKIAQIYCEVDEDNSFEWNIEGGSFPLENTNMLITVDDEEIELIREGSDEDGEYRAEYTMLDEYGYELVLDIRYNKEDKAIEIDFLEDGYSIMFIAGSIEKEDDTAIAVSIDTLEIDEEEILSGDITISNECDEITVPAGEELDVLTMSEDDWNTVLEELIMSMY